MFKKLSERPSDLWQWRVAPVAAEVGQSGAYVGGRGVGYRHELVRNAWLAQTLRPAFAAGQGVKQAVSYRRA